MTEPERNEEPTTEPGIRAGRRPKRLQISNDARLGRRSQAECENDMLKRLVADLVLEKALLSERLRELQAQD